MNILWTLEQAIQLARFIEVQLMRTKHHCALGGGCLQNGSSCKDVDIFIYPHKKPSGVSFEQARAALSAAGFKGWAKRPHEYLGDSKDVWTCEYQGKRVDVFFVS